MTIATTTTDAKDEKPSKVYVHIHTYITVPEEQAADDATCATRLEETHTLCTLAAHNELQLLVTISDRSRNARIMEIFTYVDVSVRPELITRRGLDDSMLIIACPV